ncbi:hypothetical protein QT972_24065 [Microcoleus sp. herbarium7]|uniref:LysM peptidoglycan-binding domain-containing protein n=1 Tax=Microcoleus sp. herbarium7 TaxID=3055435 RepID=UPI002FD70FD7
MSINEINPANSLKSGVDSFTGLPGSISDINRDLFGQSLSKAPNSILGGIPMNPLLESDDRSISAIQTKSRSGASSVYGDESRTFPIDRAAQQVGKALMDNTITAPVPSGDRVDRPGQYDELINPNPSNLATTVRSGDTQKELETGSGWMEFQKADGNGFTERSAYKVPQVPSETTYKVHVIGVGDTLWSIAKDKLGRGELWRALKKENSERFTEDDTFRLQIGTKVYYPIGVSENQVQGTALENRWVEYLEYCKADETEKIFQQRKWVDKNGKTIPFDSVEFGSAKWRSLDIVWILKTGKVIGFEIKQTPQAEKDKPEQEARDQEALNKKAYIREPKKRGQPVKRHQVDEVWRIQGEPPEDCEEDIKLSNKISKKNVRQDSSPPGVEVEPPNIDSRPQPQDYRSPVESEEDSEEDPEVDVERRRPKPRNINPPRFNVPARPPAIESPKPIDAPARPRTEPPLDAPARPSARPPIDDAPARLPVRPPASTTVLSGASRVARPLAVVTDVIDLTNAYNEDGGFGQNFQETVGSVAGGWGGAAAGAAAGAALGSVVPGVGTVVGGIAGGIIGGIGGSAAGEGIVKGIRNLFG